MLRPSIFKKNFNPGPAVTTPVVNTPAITTPAITTPAVTTPKFNIGEELIRLDKRYPAPVATTPFNIGEELAKLDKVYSIPAVTTPAATTPAATTPAATTPAATTIRTSSGAEAIDELLGRKRQYEALGGRLSSAETEGLTRGVLSTEVAKEQIARAEALEREDRITQKEQFEKSLGLEKEQFEKSFGQQQEQLEKTYGIEKVQLQLGQEQFEKSFGQQQEQLEKTYGLGKLELQLGQEQLEKSSEIEKLQLEIQQKQFEMSYELQKKQLAQQDADSGTVICSELYRQGYITSEELKLDTLYRANIDNVTYAGYMIWAPKIVVLMQKSGIVTQLARPLGVGWAKEMSHRLEPERKGSLTGKLLLKFGVPICRFIGNFKMKLTRRITYV